MGITRPRGQPRGDDHLLDTVTRASNALDIRLAIDTPKPLPRYYVIAVGHPLLNLGDGLVRQHKVVIDNIGKIEQISQSAVYLVGLECAGVIPRHGAVDVIPQG